MIRTHVLAVATVLLLASSLLPSVALAQTHEFKLVYWPAGATASNPSQYGNWNTGFWGVDYRFEAPLAPWGVHLQYVTGGQSSGGGSWSGLTSGSDTIWSADVSWRRQFPIPPVVATVHAFLGWGQLQWNSTFPGSVQVDTSNGFRIGADTRVPFGGGNWSVNGAVAWYPSNTATLTFTPGGSFSGSGSARDYSISVQWSAGAPGFWVAEGGYRNASFVQPSGGVCTGPTCTFAWGGFFIAAGRTW